MNEEKIKLLLQELTVKTKQYLIALEELHGIKTTSITMPRHFEDN